MTDPKRNTEKRANVLIKSPTYTILKSLLLRRQSRSAEKGAGMDSRRFSVGWGGDVGPADRLVRHRTDRGLPHP